VRRAARRRALALALALMLTGVGAAARADTVKLAFPRGAAFLDLGCAAGDELCTSAETCRWCHIREYDAWAESGHRRSWSNAVFQDGFAAEPMRPCVHCHAPLGTAGPSAHEGVACAVCHVRAGVVATARPVPGSLHPTAATPALRSPELCGGCHEFSWIGSVDARGQAVMQPMQTTLSEWRAFAAAGGRETCQDCHMPGGDHAFRGAHDPATLRAAIAVSARPAGKGRVRLAVRSVGVGHDLPTGDVFRHVTLEVAAGGARRFAEVARFGKAFALEVDHATGTLRRAPSGDTSLKPFVPVEVPGAFALPLRYRLVYHYVRPGREGEASLPRAARPVVVRTETLTQGAPARH
jgi:hypothetical protein